MTILHPCLHCHRRESCEVRKAKAKAIAGARLTVARFRCSLAEPDFPPGCRITAILTSYDPTAIAYGDVMRSMSRPVAGTVMRWAKGRVVVLFDEPIGLAGRPGEVRVLKLPSRRLKPLEEAPRELCACDFPKAADGSCALPEGLVCHNPPVARPAAGGEGEARGGRGRHQRARWVEIAGYRPVEEEAKR